MCIAAVAWQADARWPLVVIANRDEFHTRATAPLSRWTDGSGIIAGRDLAGGGTWLGIAPPGRFALLTNFRSTEPPDPQAPSRGALVTDWLTSGDEPQSVERYNGFNLLLADHRSLRLVGNRPAPHGDQLDAGVHGLSNGPYGTPWPKTQRLCADLAAWLGHGDDDPAPLFMALARNGPIAPADSEDAPVFIRDPSYGTRCSTVLLLDGRGGGRIEERSFDPQGGLTGSVTLSLGS